MNKLVVIFLALIAGFTHVTVAQEFHKDVIETVGGDLTITFIGHGTLMFEYQDNVIHIDPWTRLADYTKLPKADLIMITHDHGDHLDIEAIEACKKEGTQIVLTELCRKKIKQGEVLKNGDYYSFAGISIEAVAAVGMVSHITKKEMVMVISFRLLIQGFT